MELIKIMNWIFRINGFKFIIIAIFILSVQIIYLHVNKSEKDLELTKTKNIAESNVKIIDLSLELKPKQIYENITCKKSKNIFVSTTLCIHDVNIDIWVSGMIMKDGVFEMDLMGIENSFD